MSDLEKLRMRKRRHRNVVAKELHTKKYRQRVKPPRRKIEEDAERRFRRYNDMEDL